MAKKIILISLGVCILVLGGLTAYISTMDWNTHKAEIAAKFSEMTGKKIEFNGSISVSLLPHPNMSAHNISILNPDTAEKLATVELMETKVSLSSLLNGTPDIETLSFVGAEIWFAVDEKGRFNWQGNRGPEFSEAEQNTRLQSFSLQNAVVHYDNAKQGIKAELSQVNADIQAASLAGPYRLDGNFVKDNDHFGMAVSLGNISQLDDVSLNFAVTHPRSESYLRYDGIYNTNDGHIKGDFSGGSRQTADFINVLFGKKLLETEFNTTLLFSVGVDANTQEIKLSSFVIKYGEFIEGSGNLIIPLKPAAGERKTAEVNYQLINLDVRPILSILKAEYAEFKEKGSVYEPDSDTDVLVDISAERIIFNDSMNGFFENLTVKGDWQDNALNLDEFYAACPGNIVLNLSGSLVEDNKEPKYFLKVSLNGQDLIAFLNALEINVQPQVQSTYRNVDLTFSILGNNSGFSSNDLKMTMDKMNVASSFQVNFAESGTDYTIRLNVDSLNLDNYLPKNETEGALANVKHYFADLAFLKNLKLKGQLEAGRLIFQGAPFSNVVLKLENDDGNLKITEAKTDDVLNTAVEASGSFGGFGSEELEINDLQYKISSKNTKELLAKLQLPLPNWQIFQMKNFKAGGNMSGNLHKADISWQSSADNLRFDYKGMIEQAEQNFVFDGMVDVRTTNLGEFIRGLGGEAPNNTTTKGALNCQGKVSGNSQNWQFNEAECILGVAKYTGNLSVGRDKNNYTLTAKVETNELNLENIIEASGTKNNMSGAKMFDDNFLARPAFNKDSINFDRYRNLTMDIDLTTTRAVYKNNAFDGLKMHILNARNVMQFKDVAFVYDGVKVTGNTEISYSESPQIKGNAAIENWDLSRTGGQIYMVTSGVLNLTTDFSGPAASIEDLLNNISGKATFSVDNFAFKGIDLAKIADDLRQRKYSKGVFQAVRDNLQSGKTTFETFGGNINMNGGVLDFKQVPLKNADAQVIMNGKVSLSDWKMSESFAVKLLNVPNEPQFSFTLSGLLNKPVLDVNVEDIVKKYDEHWEQIAEAEEAEKAEAERVLNEKMTTAQKKTAEVSELVNSFVPTIETYKDKSEDKAQIAWFDEKLNRIGAINKELDKMQGKAHIAGFTEEDIAQIEAESQRFAKEIEEMKPEVENHYDQDIQLRLQKAKTSVDKVNSDNQALFNDYQKMVQDNFEMLLKINATQFMINNADLKMQQSEISRLNDTLIDMYAEIDKQYEQISQITDRAELESKIVGLKESAVQMQDLYSQMEKVRNASAEMLLKMINEQQKAYEEEQARKEAAKRAREAENAGNLLARPDDEEDELPPPPPSAMPLTAPSAPIPNTLPPRQETLQPAPKTAEQDSFENKMETSAGQKSHIIVKPDSVTKTGEQPTKTLAPVLSSKPTLRRLSGEETSGVSGQINTLYETEEKTKNSGSGLLKPIDGELQKTSGTIVVK